MAILENFRKEGFAKMDMKTKSKQQKPSSTFKPIVSFVPKSNFHSKNRKITLADLRKSTKTSKLASGNTSGSALFDQSTLATGGNTSADKTAELACAKSLQVQKTENKKSKKEPLKLKIDKAARPKSN